MECVERCVWREMFRETDVCVDKNIKRSVGVEVSLGRVY